LTGDHEAFGQLYDRHARLVRVVAADAGPARIEDVVQETFLRTYRNLVTLRAQDGFAHWLVGIARKVVREVRRKPAGTPLPAAAPDHRPDPATDTDNADEAAHLRALVARLPEQQRQAVQFFFFGRQDAHEVARLLGRSRSGTYALLREALATLARWLDAGVSPGERKP
jgi:RNA polymerase sigma-70 factor (ECF subfamily)